MNDDNDDDGGSGEVKYTGVVSTSFEANFGHEIADDTVPHEASLLEAIEGFDEAPYETFLTRDSEAGRLTHVDSSVEFTIEVGVLEIDLVDFVVVGSCECGDESKRGHASGWRGGLCVINTIDL